MEGDKKKQKNRDKANDNPKRFHKYMRSKLSFQEHIIRQKDSGWKAVETEKEICRELNAKF